MESYVLNANIGGKWIGIPVMRGHDGDAYSIGTVLPYPVYIWDGALGEWVDHGNLRGVGIQKIEQISSSRNTKPIYIDSDGILYSGLTLPIAGSVGDIPVIKSVSYDKQYVYGRTTLGGFLDGVSSTNYYHQVSLDSSIRDIIFILTDGPNDLHKVTDLCLSIGNKDIVDISSEIGSNIGSDIKIHVQSIIKGYLSVKFYSGIVEREYNFLPYTLTSQATSKILKLYSSGHTSFTCTTYYNKIV